MFTLPVGGGGGGGEEGKDCDLSWLFLYCVSCLPFHFAGSHLNPQRPQDILYKTWEKFPDVFPLLDDLSLSVGVVIVLQAQYPVT